MRLFAANHHLGFARSAVESAHPELWRGLRGSWCPALGNTGILIPDYSGKKNDGTQVGLDAATDWTYDIHGQKLDFVGDGQYITVPNDLGEGQIASILIWVKPTFGYNSGSPFSHNLVGAGSITGGHFYCYYNSSTSGKYYVFSYRFAFGTTITLTGAEFSSDTEFKKWTPVVVTFDNVNNTQSLWVNGEQQASGTTSTGTYPGNTGWRLFDATLGNQSWTGGGASVQAYDRVLTDQEIKLLSTRPAILHERVDPKVYLFLGAAGSVELVVAAINQSQSVDNVALTQANTLSVNAVDQSQNVDNVVLTQANTLSINAIDQDQSVDNVDLTQSINLSVNAVDQSQNVDNVVLVQSNVLALNSVDQDQSVDNVVLTTGVTLSLQEIGQSQGVDNIDLVQANVLAVNGIDQAQTVDNITLSTGILLAVAALSQSQSVDNVALTQANTLSVNPVDQDQSIEAVLLTQANTLAVNAINQAQSVDNIVLSTSIILSVGDLSQLQTVDGVALTQANVLAVDSLLQSQGVDNTVLVSGSVLTVASLTQSQSVDNISFVVIATPARRIYLIEAENRNYLIN